MLLPLPTSLSSTYLLPHPVQRWVPEGEPVLLVTPECGQSAGGSGGADRGLHWFTLHQPRTEAGHPRPVPAGTPGHSAAGSCLGWGGMLAQAGVLAQMHAHIQWYSYRSICYCAIRRKVLSHLLETFRRKVAEQLFKLRIHLDRTHTEMLSHIKYPSPFQFTLPSHVLFTHPSWSGEANSSENILHWGSFIWERNIIAFFVLFLFSVIGLQNWQTYETQVIML